MYLNCLLMPPELTDDNGRVVENLGRWSGHRLEEVQTLFQVFLIESLDGLIPQSQRFRVHRCVWHRGHSDSTTIHLADEIYLLYLKNTKSAFRELHADFELAYFNTRVENHVLVLLIITFALQNQCVTGTKITICKFPPGSR